ncbi:MAG: hypothetical protein RI967_728 [Planctomycetota bacterium]|jgi:hypothetical protein
MSLTKTVGFFAGTTLAIGGAAFGAENEFASEIASLRAEIAQLKGDNWLTEQRAAEIRGIVTDVLADADTRASLQGSGANAGYDGGFFISSSDGNFSLKLNILEQIRYTFNDRGGSPASPGKAQTYGFENKRTRVTWSGNIVDSTWSYNIETYFAYSNNQEGFDGILGNAYVAKDMGNGMSLTFGSFRLPFAAEYAIDAGNLQFNDFSPVLWQFNTGYAQGVMLGYAADMFRVNVAFTNGENTGDSGWTNGSPSAEYAFTGRADVKFAGTWEQFNDAQSWQGDEMGFKVGGGVSWQQANDNALDTGKEFAITLDATAEFGGANVFAAYYYVDDEDVDANQQGFSIGGGFFLSEDFEIVARWDAYDSDSGANSEVNTLTFGGNWYLAKNTAKFGANVGYAFDGVPANFGTSANWLEDASTEDGQWFIQGQLSFSF